jgi:glycosyltransferase involved in cell wall biosynthesis
VRVLHVADLVSPLGGVEAYLRDVVRLLESAGHEVAVLHGEEGADTQGLPARSFVSPGAASWVQRFRADVVHVHRTGLPSSLEGALRGSPVVYSLHDYGFACSTGTKYFRSGRICGRAHGRACLIAGVVAGCNHRVDPRPAVARYRALGHELPAIRSADGFIAHSKFMRTVALANGFAADRLSVVSPFVSVADDPVQPQPDAAQTVVFVGRVVREKGLDVLLNALALCGDKWDRLRVAGDGWQRERCCMLAKRLGISRKVDFLGQVDVAGVRAALNDSRVVTVPARWPEPFGIVGLEAMAAARPVVASAVGGIPEWLEHGRTGLLVRPGDPVELAAAVVRVLDDPVGAAAMGAEARRRVDRFSPDRHLEKLLAVYERAADRSSDRAARAGMS